MPSFSPHVVAGRPTARKCSGARTGPISRSVPDVDGDGVAYCSISPRFRWREEWSGDLLLSVLRRSLPAALAVPAGRVNLVREVRIASRTRSGRVGQLTIALGDGDVQVDGPLVRQVLRTGAGRFSEATPSS